MEVTLYSDRFREQWDKFVWNNPECWHYHCIGWKQVIERSYGHRCYYLIGLNDNEISGILPLTMIKSHLFGRSLTSLPYLDFAGLVANDPYTRDTLIDMSIRLARENKTNLIEFRQLHTVEGDFVTGTHKSTLVLELASDEEELFQSLSSERRNRIRKARNAGLSVDILGSEALPVFYKIWTENMRDLGSPAHSYSFFANIMLIFSDSAKVILVKSKENYIGAAICLFYRDKLTLPWVSSLRKAFHLYPNNILYWEAMLYAISKGCHYFDFGRSTIGSGTYDFKIRWGATAKPLYWQRINLEKNTSSGPEYENTKYKLAVTLWKRMPVSCSRFIGPIIRKYITA